MLEIHDEDMVLRRAVERAEAQTEGSPSSFPVSIPLKHKHNIKRRPKRADRFERSDWLGR